jgi:Zn-dependent protease
VNLEQLLPTIIAVGIFILVGFPVHEFSHAFAAYRLGDSTARWQGRLTLNPIKHFDPLGGGLLIVTALISRGFMIGWAKPTPVNPYNLRYGRRGEAIVALAGPLSNLVMAAAVTIPLRILALDRAVLVDMAFDPIGSYVLVIAEIFIRINVVLMIFNLLPIPPLDGWRVLLGLIDARTAYNFRQYEQYGFIVLLILVFAGGPILGSAISSVMDLLLGPVYDALLIP